jgi:hypothetical protein
MGTNKKLLRPASAIKKNNSPRGGQLCFMIDNLKFKLGITPASRTSSGTKVAILALDPICNQEKLPEKWGQI